MKKFLSIILILCTCLVLKGCSKKKNDNLSFVTSCYPVYIMALNITDNVSGVEVSSMADNHKGCLHNFQLQSNDLKKIEKSSTFIINGAGMESFLDKVIKELPSVKVIDSSEGIELIKDDDCDCEHENEHCHHEYNPHIWMSVTNYIKQVENTARGISEIDPLHAEEYKKNSEKYIAKLKALKEKMSLELGALKRKDIITFHEAFPYFAKEFGLNIAGVINHEPESEPDAKELADIIATVKKSGINALFVEPQYPGASAQIVSTETGAKIYTLDPAVTGENTKDSYIEAMRKNLETLKTALN